MHRQGDPDHRAFHCDAIDKGANLRAAITSRLSSIGRGCTHIPEPEVKELLQAPGVKALLEERPAEVVSEPFDVVPVSDAPRVRALATKGG